MYPSLMFQDLHHKVTHEHVGVRVWCRKRGERDGVTIWNTGDIDPYRRMAHLAVSPVAVTTRMVTEMLAELLG